MVGRVEASSEPRVVVRLSVFNRGRPKKRPNKCMTLFGVRKEVWLLPERLSSNEHVFRQQQKREQHKKPQ